jgi:arginase family enzyme
MQLAFIGVPYALEGDRVVSSGAWKAWHSGRLVELLSPFTEPALWVSLPEISDAPDARAQRRAAVLRLRDTIRAVYSTGTVPVVLGGDSHLVGLGILAGLQQGGASPAIAWFDAHGPLGPDEALNVAMTPSGKELADELALGQPVPSWHILLAGARDADTPAAPEIEDSVMSVWDAEDLNEGGAGELGRDLNNWPPIMLQIDLSVLDPAAMPAVRRPAAAGLTLESLVASLESVMAGGRVIALGVSNYLPEQDDNGLGFATSVAVIREAVRILTI